MDEGEGGWTPAPYARGFGRELRGCGFTDLSTAEQLRLMSHLSRWMTGEGLDALSCEQIAAYCAARKAGGYVARLTPGSLGRLQVFLRAQGVLSASPAAGPPASAQEELLGRYRAYYLAEERGLVPAVISQYLRTAALFLDEYRGLPPGSGRATTATSRSPVPGTCCDAPVAGDTRTTGHRAPSLSGARCAPECVLLQVTRWRCVCAGHGPRSPAMSQPAPAPPGRRAATCRGGRCRSDLPGGGPVVQLHAA